MYALAYPILTLIGIIYPLFAGIKLYFFQQKNNYNNQKFYLNMYFFILHIKKNIIFMVCLY